jgi:glycosyltransferase involved in cell wall biosynthesis
MKLRILVMTTVPQTLSAFFPRQLRSLADAGFDVHAVSSPGSDLDDLARIPGVTVHAIPMERQPHPWRDLSSLRHLFRLMRRLQPHIVHSHTPKAGLLGMAAAKAAGVPTRLYSIHGLPLETRTGHWRRVLESAERASAALSTRTYAISRSVNRRVLDLKLCPPHKLTTVGDGSCAGVDLERFDATAPWEAQRNSFRSLLGLPQDVLLLSFVGRLSNDKGIGVLAKAWPTIAREEPSVHLLLAGDADCTDPVAPAAFDALRSDARVHFTGGVSKTAIPSIYASTDIFVLPTFREGLSQVALESGAMGVPIVSTRVTGLDAVIDGVTGLLVPPRDPAALARAIIRLARDPELRTALGQAAKEHIRAKYSAQRVDQLWMAEYRQLVPKATAEVAQVELQIENRI